MFVCITKSLLVENFIRFDNGDSKTSDNSEASTGFSFNFVSLFKKKGQEEIEVKVSLNVGLSLYFNGFFLKHRQERPEELSEKKFYVNVGAYDNKALFDRARRTNIRNKERSRQTTENDGGDEDV